MDDDEVTSGGEGPDPLAAFLIREEFDETRDEAAGPTAPSVPSEETSQPAGSHRRGMLAGLAGVAVLLAVLVVVAPGGSRPKLAPQAGRAIPSSPTASAAAVQPSSGSTTTPGGSSKPTPDSTPSPGSKSPSPAKTASTASIASDASAGETDVVSGSHRSGDTTSTAGGGVVSSPSQTSAVGSASSTTAPAPVRTTTTAPAPPRTTTTTAAPPRTTTTTTAPPPTTTTTTICVLIVCL
jgi:hypothetical protein